MEGKKLPDAPIRRGQSRFGFYFVNRSSNEGFRACAVPAFSISSSKRLSGPTVRPDGRPHVVPIVFALVDEGRRLGAYWSVERKPKCSTEPQRLRNISVNPDVELVVDDYDEAWERLWWVRAAGTSRPVEDATESARALAALTTKYPQYARAPPVGPTVAIDVVEITGRPRPARGGRWLPSY